MTEHKEENQNFKPAALAANFEATLTKFDDLLLRADQPEIAIIRQKMQDELDKHRSLGFLTVAFVGQYSAGKSTIISALTGQRDIPIGADITTDTTASYNWNGIKLIDTPGLFTDRSDHDAITYDAIRQADLLVFSLTYMLFDSITAENFKKLAYELGYRWKMMLVVNKMSDGAGEEEELIANYRHSMALALEPYNLDELPLCFIDAKDYCEGVDEKDEFLTEISRFQTLIDSLNSFVRRRGFFARFDTPVRIALSYIDEAQLSLTRDSNEDSAFFELLNRLSRTVRQERDCLRTKVRRIALRLSAAVANEGTVLSRAVGSNVDIEALAKQAESNVLSLCEKATAEMEEAVKEAVELLQEEVKNVLNSDLAQAFVARLEVNQTFSARNVDSGIDMERLREQVNMLQDIGKRVGVGITKLATKTGSNSAGRVFLRTRHVAGSPLHKGIRTFGKFLGFKFKPWQAVNIAKGIGNVAKFLGPLLSVGMLAVDIYAKEEEEQQDKKLSDARRDITSQFIALGKDLEDQTEMQLKEVEVQVYGEIEKQIAKARHDEETAIASSNEFVAQLVAIRKEFDTILCEINNSSNTTALL